jgi:hypothetical protein
LRLEPSVPPGRLLSPSERTERLDKEPLTTLRDTEVRASHARTGVLLDKYVCTRVEATKQLVQVELPPRRVVLAQIVTPVAGAQVVRLLAGGAIAVGGKPRLEDPAKRVPVFALDAIQKRECVLSMARRRRVLARPDVVQSVISLLDPAMLDRSTARQ